MATYNKRPNFFTSEDGIMALKMLNDMVVDRAYKTDASYTANGVTYPTNLLPFVDKHMSFLRDHPNTNYHQYILNLRLMTKVRN